MADPRCLPLEPERWADFERLFGSRGACGGCWCMTPLLTRKEFERGKGDGNRRAMQALVESGTVPGLVAYDGADPVAWCAVQPRAAYGWLTRSRVLAPVDDEDVWSVACFFVHKDHRGHGWSVRMLEHAADWAREHGARWLEGYPVEPPERMPAAFAWTGLASAYRRAGFEEVLRRSPTRPIFRKRLRR